MNGWLELIGQSPQRWYIPLRESARFVGEDFEDAQNSGGTGDRHDYGRPQPKLAADFGVNAWIAFGVVAPNDGSSADAFSGKPATDVDRHTLRRSITVTGSADHAVGASPRHCGTGAA
jgi:hypothetical protein